MLSVWVTRYGQGCWWLFFGRLTEMECSERAGSVGLQMATALLGRIKSLYRSVSQQRKVVETQRDSLEFMQEANVFIDVPRLTGVTLEEESGQLEIAHGVLDNLNARLGRAIALWGQLPLNQKDREELSWPRLPEPDLEPESLEPPVQEFELPRRPQQNIPSLADPQVGSVARYTQPWGIYTEAQTGPGFTTRYPPRGVASWVQDRNHHGLRQPSEQTRLENSANAVQFSRTYAPPPRAPTYAPAPAATYPQSFTEQVRQAQSRQHHQAVPPLPPLYGVELSYRRGRENSSDFWLDDDFEPDFWQKNLRPGNIWTDPPRYPIPPSIPVSPKTIPKTIPRGPRANDLGRVVAANAFERSGAHGLQVGGTCASSYFPQAKKQDFRAFTSDPSS